MNDQEFSSSKHLFYYIKHLILICIICKYTIKFEYEINWYFWNMHSNVNLKVQWKLVTYIIELKIRVLKNIFILKWKSYKMNEFNLLKECEYNEYKYACINARTMIKYYQKKYEWMKINEVYWNEYKVQSFLAQKKRKYFMMNTNEKQDNE